MKSSRERAQIVRTNPQISICLIAVLLATLGLGQMRAFADSNEIFIMPLGDSITYGTSSTFDHNNCPDDMIAYWNFDESVTGSYEDSYNGHDGFCVGTCPDPCADGKVGGAQDFNGTSDGMDVNDHNDFDWAATDDWTVEFWMKKDVAVGSGGTNDNEVIIGRNESGIVHWWLGVQNTSGAIHFQLPDSGGSSTVIEGPKVDDGKWHHIVAIREGSLDSMVLYVDGVDVNSLSSFVTQSFASAENLNIGWMNLAASYYHYEGLLDELAIYNRALTEEEILEHYYLAHDYCQGCAEPIKIMPLGDSITVGNASGASPDDVNHWVSYRKDLWEMLADEGYTVDFVGSQTHGDAYEAGGFDPNHEGHGGWRDDEIAWGRSGYPHPNGVYEWLDANPADVALLHIGTNGLNTSAEDVNDIFKEIDRWEADNDRDVTVIMAKIINRMNAGCGDGDTHTFNTNIEAMANDRIADGDKIIVVDMECGAAVDYNEQPGGDMYDSVHPYATGYAKMADVWFDALDTFLPRCGPYAPIITSVPVTQAYVNETYEYQVEASASPDPNFFLIEDSPSDMDINMVTGLITWEPNTIGDFNVVVLASNTEGNDVQAFTIEVNEIPPFSLRINCGGPTVVDGNITWVSSASYVTGGADYDFGMASVDTTTNSIAEPVPPLAVYNKVRHQSPHTYSIPEVTDGSYVVRIHWTDKFGGDRQIDYDIEGVRVEEDWDIVAEAGGTAIAIDKEYIVTVSDGNGMQIVSSMDNANDAFESAIEITTLTPAAPNIVSTAITAATEGVLYSYDVDATGFPAPTYSLTTWPSAMDINTVNGLITWTPAGIGDFNVAVLASNSEGNDVQAFTITVAEAPPCPNDITHYWKLDEAGSPYEDSIGTADAGCTNCPTPVGGRVGGAQWFDGSNDEVQVPDDDTYDWAKDDSFTFEFWMKTNQTSPANNMVFIGRDDGPTSLHWWIGTEKNTGKVRFQLQDSTGNGLYLGNTGPDLDDNNWHHIVCVRDESLNENRVYVDSNLVDSGTYNYLANFAETVPMNVGYVQLGSHHYRYEGAIDELAIYDRALTVPEIQQHYNNGLAGMGYCLEAPTITSEPDLIAEVNTLYVYDVESRANPIADYNLLEAPSGMDINTVSGLITWTPMITGDVNVVVLASNTEGNDVQAFTIEVNEIPPFSLRINCGGPTVVDGNITWVSSAGYVSGGSDFDFGMASVDTITNSIAEPVPPLAVYNKVRHESSHTYSIPEVTDGSYVVRIHWTDKFAAVRDIDYDIEGVRVEEDWDIVAEAGGTAIAIDKEYVVTVSDGNGMQIVSSAALPSDAFESAIEITTLTLAPAAPNIISTPVTDAYKDELYSYDVDATGYPAPTYSLTVKPAGMDINDVNGLITWTPAVIGDFNVVVLASNSEGNDVQNFTIAVTAPPVCPNDMDHYWQLEEDGSPYEDSYGTNDATCTSCPSQITDGKIGNAQDFDGTNNLDVADDGTFDWTGNFSIEYWLRSSSTVPSVQVIIGRQGTVHPEPHIWTGLSNSGDQVMFVLLDSGGSDGGNGSWPVSGFDVTDGAWHHVVAVKDSTHIRLYVDGTERQSFAKSYPNGFASNQELNIGWLDLSPYYRYDGDLDEVALYSRALTPTEVSDHWNAGAGKRYCSDDTDGDGVGDDVDNCPNVSNPDQNDIDTDGAGDICDNCPTVSNSNQVNSDTDSLGDLCDNCPNDTNPDQNDVDADDIGDICDNCPDVNNPSQVNSDTDSFGDKCDNCPDIDNPAQDDTDTDGIGDECECEQANIDNVNPVDFTDYAILSEEWLTSGSLADTNWDAIVDIADLAQVTQWWLENCN